MRRAILNAMALIIAALFSTELRAQFSMTTERGINGQASVTIERPAERLLVQVVLMARSSKDLPDALKKMKVRRAQAEKQLEKLGAIKQSVKFGDVKVDDDAPAHQGVSFAVPAGAVTPFGAVGLPHGPPEAKRAHKLKMSVSAEWALKSTDQISLLLEGTKLQDAIKKADLAGLEDELTAEEEEEEEEANPNMVVGIPGGRRPGEPEFVYLTTISDAEYNKAMAEAFQLAKAKADNVSKAIAVPLDSLQSVQVMGHAETGDGDTGPVYYPGGGLYTQTVAGTYHGDSEKAEAMGSSPGILKYKVTVATVYSLKSAAKQAMAGDKQ